MVGSVFKYYAAERGLQVLRNLELKITPPDQLNDVFEFSPHFVCSAPSRMARNVLRAKSTVRECYHEDRKAGYFTGTERQYRRLWRSRRTRLQGSLTDTIVDNLPVMQSRFPLLHSRHSGVLCLTSNPDSVVMWSHYGDNHRGIVLEFDCSWPLFAEAKGLRRVEYVRERPRWDEGAKHGSEAEAAQFDAVIFSKNQEWGYESELRQLFLLKGLKSVPLDDGREGHFLSIPPRIIKGVRLGMFCKQETLLTVGSILQTAAFSHVALKQARMHDKEYRMTARDLPC